MEDFKVILFDVDGVLVRSPHYFSRELERQGYKNAGKVLDDFFSGEFHRKCLVGEGQEELEIETFLERAGWEKSGIDYMKEHCEFEAKFLDEQFINLIQELRNDGKICCVATDQEKFRANYLLNEMNFKNLFDDFFSACFLGARKNSNKFWEETFKLLKDKYQDIAKNEILFIDDRKENVGVAEKFGIKGFLFEDKDDFLEKFNFKK